MIITAIIVKCSALVVIFLGFKISTHTFFVLQEIEPFISLIIASSFIWHKRFHNCFLLHFFTGKNLFSPKLSIKTEDESPGTDCIFMQDGDGGGGPERQREGGSSDSRGRGEADPGGAWWVTFDRLHGLCMAPWIHFVCFTMLCPPKCKKNTCY